MKKISYRPVYNRKNRLNKQGKALLQIEAYLEKRKVYFSSHIHLTPQQWDKRRERIVAHPNAEALNLMLATFMMELEQKELELWKNGQDITLEKLKETFIKENMHTFLEFAKREIEDSQLKESTRKNRLTTCHLLAKFKQRISFKDLTSKFIFEFESFLYQQGCHTNTVAKHMKHLKLLVNSAINKGYIDSGNYALSIPDKDRGRETCVPKARRTGKVGIDRHILTHVRTKTHLGRISVLLLHRTQVFRLPKSDHPQHLLCGRKAMDCLPHHQNQQRGKAPHCFAIRRESTEADTEIPPTAEQLFHRRLQLLS